MARSVSDAAFFLAAMAGPDPRSPQSLHLPPDRFLQPLERDFRGARIAWSRSMGGLPMEPEVTRVLDGAMPALRSLGCEVEEADPDLHDADEIFEVLRAWYFEAAHGENYRKHRAKLKQTVIWNIEEGLRLTGPQVGRAELKRTQLFHRMARFFERYDYLVCPVVQVLPFDVRTEYPMEIDGHHLGSYIEWIEVLLSHLGDDPPGPVCAGRLQCGRAAGRTADRRTVAGRLRRPAARTCLRGRRRREPACPPGGGPLTSSGKSLMALNARIIAASRRRRRVAGTVRNAVHR